MRIVLVDQIDLPLPVPALELLLAQDRRFHLAEQFEMDEAMDAVFGGEAGKGVVAMLPQTAGQIGGDTDVKGAVVPAGKNVDARLAFFPHAPELAAKWVLKQVQDDELEPNRSQKLKRHAELVSAPIAPEAPRFAFLRLPRGMRSSARPGQAARWVLKQVQDDDNCEGGVLA